MCTDAIGTEFNVDHIIDHVWMRRGCSATDLNSEEPIAGLSSLDPALATVSPERTRRTWQSTSIDASALRNATRQSVGGARSN